MPQKMSYHEYIEFAFEQAKKQVEVVSLRAVAYDNVGNVYTPDEGYVLDDIQGDQRLWARLHDYDPDAQSFIQVSVKDVIEDDLVHVGSDWMEPSEVDAWIKGQRR